MSQKRTRDRSGTPRAGRHPVDPGRADEIRAHRSGRRLALAALFEAEFGQRTAPAILERHLAETETDAPTAAFARDLVATVVARRDRIDATIERLAPQYPVVQLARMDRALLRVAIGEVLHSATPARVAIAEWVELARTYSGDPMRRLMNGVLGKLTRGAGPGTSGPAGQQGHPDETVGSQVGGPISEGGSQWPPPTSDSRRSSSSSSASMRTRSSPKPRSSTT